MNGVTIDRTAIRSTPGGDIVRSIPAGMSLTFTAELGSWLHVFTVDGKPQGGYVNTKSVRVTSGEVVTPPVDPPVIPTTNVTHVILVNDTGKISTDGLPYE